MYPTILLDGEDSDGVTIPKLLTAELLDQVPPTGLAVNTKEALRHIEVNTGGVILGTRIAAREMIKRKELSPYCSI
jgi:hypothetical protein